MNLYVDKQPGFESLRKAADWLAETCHETLDLQQTLQYLIQHKIIPQDVGGQVAIACSQGQIKGIILLRPHHSELLLEACDALTTKNLFDAIDFQTCPKRVFTSGQLKSWIKPLLLQKFDLVKEYDQLVMVGRQTPQNTQGRWATQQDLQVLDRYARAYFEERGSGNPHPNWLPLVKQNRVAVLEAEGQIVSVVKRGQHTAQYARILAPFTFPAHRRKGYAHKLLAFFIRELLQQRPAVHLFVDDDNLPAIALYKSLGFQLIGRSYAAYFE